MNAYNYENEIPIPEEKKELHLKMKDAVKNGNIFQYARYENGVYYYQFTKLMQQYMSDKNSKVYKAWEAKAEYLGLR